MHVFPFLNSNMCSRVVEPNPEPDPFKLQLPPDSQLPKMTREPTTSNLYDLARKNEELKALADKNAQLVSILSFQESEKTKLLKKYNELLNMYEELKMNEVSELAMQETIEENRVLLEKISLLEKALLEAEKELARRSKLYEDKNEESRRLLEKLNENITRREEKLASDLSEVKSELQKRDKENSKLELRVKAAERKLIESEEQRRRALEEAERQKSAFISNLSTMELREGKDLRDAQAQTDNIKLLQASELLQQKQRLEKNISSMQLERLKHETRMAELMAELTAIKQLNDEMSIQNRRLANQVKGMDLEIEELNNQFEQEELRRMEVENSLRIAEVQIEESIHKLRAKQQEIKCSAEKYCNLESHYEKTRAQTNQLKDQCSGLARQQKAKAQAIAGLTAELETGKQYLRAKIEQIASLQLKSKQLEEAALLSDRHMQALQRETSEQAAKCEQWRLRAEHLEELLATYKAEQAKIRQERDQQWIEMTALYQHEIEKLNLRLLETQGRASNKNAPRLSPEKI